MKTLNEINRWKIVVAAWALPGALLGVGCGETRIEPADTEDGDTGDDGGDESGVGDGGGTGGLGDTGDDGGVDDGGVDDGGVGDGGAGGCAEQGAATVQMLATYCGACHGPGGTAQGGFDYVTDLDRMVAEGRIVAGDAASSPAYQLIESGTMPPAAITDRPTPEDLALFGEWINACADSEPSGGDCSDNPVIGIDEQFELMLTDVGQIDADDRETTRYVSLAYLHNQGQCSNEVDIARQALGKILNSVSTEAGIEQPECVDNDCLIYRIELEEYGLDDPLNGFATKWDAMLDANDFGAVSYQGDEADTLAVLTNTEAPAVLVGLSVLDAFLTADLYYDIVGAANTLGGQAALLGIDLDDNLDDLELFRAGFRQSGVAFFNRVVERHDANVQGSSLWIAFDFAAEDLKDDDPFLDPLGFQGSGAEVTWTLPNGLHGYMIVDANGNRLDVAPADFINDPIISPAGDMTAALSCFRCHRNGVNGGPTGDYSEMDEILEFASSSALFNADEKEDFEEVYSEDLVDLARRDSDLYLGALQLTGVPSSGGAEPVSTMYISSTQGVDLARAAAELGVLENVLLTNISALSPNLQVLATGGSVDYEVWKQLFVDTCTALNVCEAANLVN